MQPARPEPALAGPLCRLCPARPERGRAGPEALHGGNAAGQRHLGLISANSRGLERPKWPAMKEIQSCYSGTIRDHRDSFSECLFGVGL